MESPVSFSGWLKEQRKAADLTQRDLAQAVGCSVITVKKLESGELRPSKALAKLLADFFDIPPAEHSAFIQFSRSKGPADEQPEPASFPAQPAQPSAPSAQQAPWQAQTAPAAPHNLPAPLNSFVGRAQEIAVLAGLLADPAVRLVTVSGAPGVGKTRLAQETGTRVLNLFPDGVYFVPLGPVNSHELVAPAVHRALDLLDQGKGDPWESLRLHLQDKQLLLLLDNMEHVLPAAVGIAGLLADAPGVKVLATSRELLNLYGEQCYELLPLPLPTTRDAQGVESLLAYDAVRLFVDRARSARADFALSPENARTVAEICERLDGLPLAIELAAGHAKGLSPDGMLSRLKSADGSFDLLADGPRNLPERHRALGNAVEWSYNLLDEDEKLLFRRLSVFSGGATLAAVRAVLDDPMASDGQLEAQLQSLLDKSLLRFLVWAEPRYHMLVTIQQFAREQARRHGEMEMLRRLHARYYASLAEQAEAEWLGPRQGHWASRLEEEYSNLASALEWTLGGEHSRRESNNVGELAEAEQIGLRLSAALWRFWQSRGPVSQGRKWMERALTAAGLPPLASLTATATATVAATPASDPPSHDGAHQGATTATIASAPVWLTTLRAKLLFRTGDLALHQGDVVTALQRFEASLAVCRLAGDSLGAATALNGIGMLHQERGDAATARARYEESLQLARELGDRHAMANALLNLGGVSLRGGDYERAHALLVETLELRRQFGDARGMAGVLINLGVTARNAGDLQAAQAHYEEAEALSRQIGDKRTLSICLLNLGNMYSRNDDYDAARARYEEALGLAREMGDKGTASTVLSNLGNMARKQGSFERAAALYRECLAIRRDVGNKMGISYCLTALGEIYAELGDPRTGALLRGAADALREETGLSIPPADRPRLDEALEAIRSRLDPAEWEVLYAQGRTLGTERAIFLALDTDRYH